jgi:Family of unknown function (DUF6178)
MPDEPQDRRVIPLFGEAEARSAAPLTDLAGRPRGSERMKAILAQKDPQALVEAMPVQDLYFLVNEIGLADAQELVELATPEQLQGMIDLDAWQGDHFENRLVLPWLEMLVDAGPEKLTQVWHGLDAELAALIVQRWTRVYNLVEEEIPDDEEPPFFPTPDRFFMIKITASDDAEVRLVERTFDWMYRVDQPLARHILRAAHSEPTAELEEMAYRWRSGRLADLGYAAYDEALEVYRPLDPQSVKPDEQTREAPTDAQKLPAPLAGPAVGTGFLARVLARISDADEAARLETALVMLLNRVLAADRISPGDTTAAVAGAARAAATLSLGLETFARGDLERGVLALSHVSLTRLHRLGHSVGLQLGRLLAALGARAARLDEPYASIATALRGYRPLYSRLLDEPAEAGTRPITTLEDLRRATLALTRVAAQTVLVFDVLGADPVQIGDAATLGDVGRTATAHALLGHEASAQALRLPDVVALAEALPEGQVPETAREKVARAFGERAAAQKIPLPPEWAAVVDGWMGDLGRGVARRGNSVVLDRRFVEGLLVE